MKKITLTLAVVSVLSLHAEESFGLMQGLADSIFGSDDKTEKKVQETKEPLQSKTKSVDADTNVAVTEVKKEATAQKTMTLEQEINEKEEATLQNFIDRQLNQGKYDPENMTEEQRERFHREEAHAEKQRKIDHEKGFSAQSIVDKMFNQGEYSPEKMAK